MSSKPAITIQTVHGVMLPISRFRNAIKQLREDKQTENRNRPKPVIHNRKLAR